MSDAGEELDILDRIGQDLPVEVRAAYYREMNYCRSLPENDEILRILRAMQFLTLLIQQVPERVVVEREKLQGLFRNTVEQLSEAIEGAGEYQHLLEQRLVRLPAEVAEGLRPEVVARQINENLRQQFVNSTIPQTAQALNAIAAQLRNEVTDFGNTAAKLSHSHRGAVAEARQAISELERAVSHAADTARSEATQLSAVFQREFRWSLYALSSLALAVGLSLGILYQRWVDQPLEQKAQPEMTIEKAPVKARSKAGH